MTKCMWCQKLLKNKTKIPSDKYPICDTCFKQIPKIERDLDAMEK